MTPVTVSEDPMTPITGTIEPAQVIAGVRIRFPLRPLAWRLEVREANGALPLKWLLIQPRVGDSSARPAETTVGICGEALDATSICEEARDKADIDLR